MADASVIADWKRAYQAVKKPFAAAGQTADEVGVPKAAFEQLVHLVADGAGSSFTAEQRDSLGACETHLAKGDDGRPAISVPRRDVNALLKLAGTLIQTKSNSSGAPVVSVRSDAIRATAEVQAIGRVVGSMRNHQPEDQAAISQSQDNVEEDITDDASVEQLRRKLCSMARRESTLHSRSDIAVRQVANNATENCKSRSDASTLCAEVFEAQKELASKHERSLAEEIAEQRENEEAWGACESLESSLREARESFADETSAWARKLVPLHAAMLRSSRVALQDEDETLALWRKLPRYDDTSKVAQQVLALAGQHGFKQIVEDEDAAQDKENIEPQLLSVKEASSSSTSVLATELQAAQEEAQTLRRGVNCLERAAEDLRDSLRSAAPRICSDRRWARAIPRLTTQLELARSEIEKLKRHAEYLRESAVTAEGRVSVKSQAASSIWRWIAELIEYREQLQEQLFEAEISTECSLLEDDGALPSTEQDSIRLEGSIGDEDMSNSLSASDELESEAMRLRARVSERECRFTRFATSLEAEKRCRLGAEAHAQSHSVILRHVEGLHEVLRTSCVAPDKSPQNVKEIEDVVAKEILAEAHPELSEDMHEVDMDIRSAVREAWNDVNEKDLQLKVSDASTRRNSFDAAAVLDLASTNSMLERKKALEQKMQILLSSSWHAQLDDPCEAIPMELPKLQVVGRSSFDDAAQEVVDLQHLHTRLLTLRARRRLVGVGVAEVEAKESQCRSLRLANRLEQLILQASERAVDLRSAMPDIGAVQQKYSVLEEECRKLRREVEIEEAAMSSQSQRCTDALSRKAQWNEKQRGLMSDKSQKEDRLNELVSITSSSAKLKSELHEEQSECNALQQRFTLDKTRSVTDRALADGEEKKLAKALAEIQKQQQNEEREVKTATMREKLLASRRRDFASKLENEESEASNAAATTQALQEEAFERCQHQHAELLAEFAARKERLLQRREDWFSEWQQWRSDLQEVTEQAIVMNKAFKEASRAPTVIHDDVLAETIAPISSPVEAEISEAVARISSPVEGEVSQDDVHDTAPSLQDQNASPKKRPRTPEEEVGVPLEDVTLGVAAVASQVDEPSEKVARIEAVQDAYETCDSNVVNKDEGGTMRNSLAESVLHDEKLSTSAVILSQVTIVETAGSSVADGEHTQVEQPRSGVGTSEDFEAVNVSELGEVATVVDARPSETSKAQHHDAVVDNISSVVETVQD